MRLDWFRTHKQFIYYILLPVVVIGMGAYGVLGRSNSGPGAGTGPSIEYTVGSKTVRLSPTEVLQQRLLLHKYENNSANPSSVDVGTRAADIETARALGFEIGPSEMKERLRQTVEYKVKSLDRGNDDVKVDNEVYDKLLQQMEISRTQFEQLVHDEQMRYKMLNQLATSLHISDPELFVKYSEDKEVVRFRFKTFKSEDFLKSAKEPDEAAIKSFYDQNTSEEARKNFAYRDMLWTEPKLSVEALSYRDEKIFADIKATDDDLKKYYEIHKKEFWREPVKPSDPAAKKDEPKKDEPKKDESKKDEPKKDEPKKEEPKEEFQPFDKVKSEVETHWKQEQTVKAKSQIIQNVSGVRKDLEDEEKKFAADKANEGKTFDVAAWAKKHNMSYWVTDELTRDQFSKGKMAVDAKDLKVGGDIFRYAATRPGMDPAAVEKFRKHMDEFTSLEWFDNDKPELGGVIARKKKFEDQRVKTLEEAKPKIVEHLKETEAVELARKEAQKVHDDWNRGENLPKLEDLDEVTSDKKASHPLVEKFRAAPKTLGDVLDVAEGMPDPDGDKDKEEKPEAERKWFYVGCAVERKLPTWTTFVKDTDFARKDKRGEQRNGDWSSIHAMFSDVAGRVNRLPASQIDPPLGEAMRRSRQQGE